MMQESWFQASWVVQWLRICLPVKGTLVPSLVRKLRPICHGPTKPVHHNYWAHTLKPGSHSYWARMLQEISLQWEACAPVKYTVKSSPCSLQLGKAHVHSLLIHSGSAVKKLPAMQEMQVRSLGWEDALGEGMATHSSVLARVIPWTE